MLITTISDKYCFNFVRLQAETVKKYLKEVDYIIWDIGLDPAQADELSNFGFVLNFADDEFNGLVANIDKKIFRKAGGKTEISLASLKKPFIIRNCVNMGFDNILYLDADAFFVNPICAELKVANYNIGVTLRKPQLNNVNLSNPRKYRFKLLNAGVQLFKGEKDLLIAFLNEFIYNYIMKQPEHSDQGNLNCIIDKCKNWDWKSTGCIRKLPINGAELKVLIANCRRYNFFGDHRANYPTDTVIVHLKGQSKRKLADTDWHTLYKHYVR